MAGLSGSGLELGYFNGIMQISKDGRDTQHQSLHAFVQGVRGIAGPFIGAAAMTLCGEYGISVRYIFLISTILMISGAVMLFNHARRCESSA